MASQTTLRRLMKEYQSEQKQQQQLQEEQQKASSSSTPATTLSRTQAARDENILSLKPRDSELKDLLHWTAIIRGPLDGCYDGD
jgi:ubiquitin-protein ligase